MSAPDRVWFSNDRHAETVGAWGTIPPSGCVAYVRADLLPKWQPIETAPDFERVWVAGWQPKTDNVIGYWWRHDDVCEEGVAIEHPSATHWCRHNTPPYPPNPTT